MNTPSEDPKPSDNMELLKQQASSCCGPGCRCHTTGTPGRTRWMIGAIVLLAAGAMALRAVINSNRTTSKSSEPSLPSLAASPAPAGASLEGLAELNATATNSEVVFVFVPVQDGAAGEAPLAAMKGAARTIEAKTGMKCGLFTVKAGSSDYEQAAGQVKPPGVLALVKGRGVCVISGEITEAKLVQGFLSASSACDPSSGCCPK